MGWGGERNSEKMPYEDIKTQRGDLGDDTGRHWRDGAIHIYTSRSFKNRWPSSELGSSEEEVFLTGFRRRSALLAP